MGALPHDGERREREQEILRLKSRPKFLLLIGLLIYDPVFAGSLECHGDLSIRDVENKVHSGGPFLRLERSRTEYFVILDKNAREVAKVWPWNTLQFKPLLYPDEQRRRKLDIKTDQLTWISVQIDSSSVSQERNRLYCDVQELE